MSIIDCIGNRGDSEIRQALVDDGRWVVVGDQHKDGILGPLPRLVVRLCAGAWVAVVSLVRSRRGCAVPRGTCHTCPRGQSPLTSERDRHLLACAGGLRPNRERSHCRQARRRRRSSTWSGTDQSEQRGSGTIVKATKQDRDVVAADPNERIDQLERRALLSALWMFVLLNFIFRDLHEIVKADFLADALNGIYGGREVTEAMFLLGGIIVEVPILMMLMAWILPLRANRWANTIVAPLFGLTFIGAPGDLDDYFHFGLILAALAVIVWKANATNTTRAGAMRALRMRP